MTPKTPSSGPKKTIEAGLNRQKIRAALSFKPSEDFKEQRDKLHKRIAFITRMEKSEQDSADEYLEASLTELDEEESNAYEETVDEATKKILEEGSEEEKGMGIRYQIMASVLTQTVFKERYAKWKKQYERKKDKPGFKKTLTEFIVEQGTKHVMLNKRLVLKARIAQQVDELGEKEDDEKKEKERREKLEKDVLKFLQRKEKLILSKKADLMALQKEFVSIFLKHGHTEDEKDILNQLFWDVVGDIEYAQIVVEDLNATAEEMIYMSYLDLTDEEWEQRRQQALKKNAKGELKEFVEEMIQPTFAPTGTLAGPEVSFSSVRELGNASGVHIRRVKIQGQEGRNLYRVDFPYLKDSSYEPPLLEISFPEGSNDLSEATYTIEDPDADPHAPNTGRPLRKRTTRYNAAEIPVVMARIQLDYELRKAARQSGDGSLTPEYVNSNLSDNDLRFMAERLLGFSFQEKPLLPPHMGRCKNLFAVLSMPDGSFPSRVKRMRNALNDDSLVPYIREILDTSGSRIKNVSTIIEEAKTKRGGVEV